MTYEYFLYLFLFSFLLLFLFSFYFYVILFFLILGDRQIRTAAAELLHGVLTLIVGTAAYAQKDRTGKVDSKYAVIYSNLLPSALLLSISSDLICRQLFHTLIFQLIRWFAGNDNVHRQESAAMINSLLVGLVDRNDTKLRIQVCACVRAMMMMYFSSKRP